MQSEIQPKKHDDAYLRTSNAWASCLIGLAASVLLVTEGLNLVKSGKISMFEKEQQTPKGIRVENMNFKNQILKKDTCKGYVQ